MSAPGHIVETEPHWLTLRDAIATPFALEAAADAVYLPQHHPSFKGYTRGCLYDSDGVRVDLSARTVRVGVDEIGALDQPVLPPEQRGGTWLSGRTLYLGPFMNRYGAFITESLSHCWLTDAGPFDRVAAYPFTHDNGDVQVQEFHRHLAGVLNVPLDRMEVMRGQTVFDEIVVPEQLWTHNLHVNAKMREVYGRIRDGYTGRKPSGRIFLSRAPSDHLANTLAVEEVLAGFGFRVLYPDQIKMADQLPLYVNCEVLASLSGSGMLNCLFARPGLLTIEIGDMRARRTPSLTQRMANTLAQCDARFIPFGEGADARISRKSVRKHLSIILGELPRRGPVLLLRLKRKMGGLKIPRSKPQADLRGGS